MTTLGERQTEQIIEQQTRNDPYWQELGQGPFPMSLAGAERLTEAVYAQHRDYSQPPSIVDPVTGNLCSHPCRHETTSGDWICCRCETFLRED